ncbi:MAG: hypothetical protein HGA44_06380 [Cellulomonadaceae bacterium]|nr:hypothetical protein [Cellulomonadaceae bacterium]
MSTHDPMFQERMITAWETQMVWCTTHGHDPLDPTTDLLRHAATDLRRTGAGDVEVLDLIDQVGFTSGLWRTLEWVHLRRTA